MTYNPFHLLYILSFFIHLLAYHGTWDVALSSLPPSQLLRFRKKTSHHCLTCPPQCIVQIRTKARGLSMSAINGKFAMFISSRDINFQNGHKLRIRGGVSI